MKIIATFFNLYHVCKRELWLHANGIRFEQTSDLVYEGKLIHETSYPQRPERFEELEIDGIKIDFYDARNKVVHEIKKSDKVEEAHEWQLKYYLYVLERNGVEGVKGILEYPTLRKTTPVILSDHDRAYIEEVVASIRVLINQEDCPPFERKSICRNCSYYDFCFINEEDIV
ncbi:CRISPR-associated protein Cas4 [Parabacteroides sp. 52]|uniref:CRISPR-associated protein Cas4 n=1 Tax=unclassified Parabacteroides TaxID=2649774 RepID=UPI0013CFBFAE|nr:MULTISPECIES: CRISPR-associated protein Cas4 [unclassified Parabacteroides]MDH6534998.1 CRISPR-associated exonuclease Cas4 [Parabacteroides sp. PM5-20]NDV55258.1 CRISPR-associated protein Cas4 [Parabacteroides sp. 52]